MKISELNASVAVLSNISPINIILGRNGAGKSRFLRTLDSTLAGDLKYNIRYISPERAGVFKKDGNVESHIENHMGWLRNARSRNQAENFKAASASLLRELEMVYLRRLESTPSLRNDPDRNFRFDRLEKINRLLSNVSILQESGKIVFVSSSGEKVEPHELSSGESEAVALASEIMHFFDTLSTGSFNVLLLDEPDVHLHPDLQARLSRLLISSIEGLDPCDQGNVCVVIATHSSPLVCALASTNLTTIGTKQFGRDEVEQISAPDSLRKAAPFFGHPLSLCLSNDTLLIVEGEDDERVWQQAVRTSQGRIRLFPVVADSVDQQTELEKACAPLLAALYDSPVAFSIRDGDGLVGGMEGIGPVLRFRLQTYSVENLLLTDECLSILGTDWSDFREKTMQWTLSNPEHRDCTLLATLIGSDNRLRHTKIKAIRQLICGICGTLKPWDVVVGQAIAKMDRATAGNGFSMVEFIGREASFRLGLIND